MKESQHCFLALLQYTDALRLGDLQQLRNNVVSMPQTMPRGGAKRVPDGHWCLAQSSGENCAFQTMQYIDALRLGDLRRFREIEEVSRDWWFPTLDRGAGAALHFAADHGQVTCQRDTALER